MGMRNEQLDGLDVWGGNHATDRAVAVPGLDAWVYAKPCGEPGGGADVCYVSSCATGRIARLLVADVAAHGQLAADVVTGLRTLMRRHVNRIDPSRFVQAMNEQFAAVSDAGGFATALVATYFAPTNTLSLCNAGQPPPLLYRAATGQWSFLDQHCAAGGEEFPDVPLGVVDLVNYDEFDVSLDAGDVVVCYTDALTETRDAAGEPLGLAGVLRLAQSIDARDSAAVIPQFLAAVRACCGHAVCNDGLTLLLFRATGQGRVPLRDRILAPLRMMRNFLGSFRGDEPMAWPEWSLPSVGGVLFAPLNRSWAHRRAPHLLAAPRLSARLPDPALYHTAAPPRPAGAVPRLIPQSAADAAAAAIETRGVAESATAAPAEVNSAA